MKRATPIFILILLFCALPLARAAKSPVRNGEDSARVAVVQARLSALGFFPYRPTGNFGTLTQNAVMGFQRAAGLWEDGEAGEETLSALFAADAPAPPFAPRVALTYSAPQGGVAVYGDAIPWAEVQKELKPGMEITVTHAHHGTSCTLVLIDMGGHAHLTPNTDADAQTLNKWLGRTNSFYKCAVVAIIPRGQSSDRAAAALLWNGEGRVCLYFFGSSSDIFGLPDADAEQLIFSCTKR
ncbi:MAG: peptidoglycan-binding protein [Clostridiales bacterium]|nr:peptidoglycan-binding protein [Clostridiales bacterium]